MELIIQDSIINGTVYGRNILYGGVGEDKQLTITKDIEKDIR